eukprot:21954-Pyramimonas_sp.AAC.1
MGPRKHHEGPTSAHTRSKSGPRGPQDATSYGGGAEFRTPLLFDSWGPSWPKEASHIPPRGGPKTPNMCPKRAARVP